MGSLLWNHILLERVQMSQDQTDVELIIDCEEGSNLWLYTYTHTSNYSYRP